MIRLCIHFYAIYQHDSPRSLQLQEIAFFTESFKDVADSIFLDTIRGDSPPKENIWSFGNAKPLQNNPLSIDHRPFQSLTSHDDGYQSTGDLQSGNGNVCYSRVENHQQIGLTTNSFAGGNAECDKVNLGGILTPATGTCTQRKNYVASKENTIALKNVHSVAGSHNKPSLLSSVTSGLGTATATNSSLYTCNAMDNYTCTVNTSQTKDNTTITKPVATTGLSKLEKSKSKEEPVVYAAPPKTPCYNKSTYTVLIRDSVRVVNTKVYSSLPLHSKYMVKERIPGTNKVKLVLKSCCERFVVATIS